MCTCLMVQLFWDLCSDIGLDMETLSLGDLAILYLFEAQLVAQNVDQDIENQILGYWYPRFHTNTVPCDLCLLQCQHFMILRIIVWLAQGTVVEYYPDLVSKVWVWKLTFAIRLQVLLSHQGKCCYRDTYILSSLESGPNCSLHSSKRSISFVARTINQVCDCVCFLRLLCCVFLMGTN